MASLCHVINVHIAITVNTQGCFLIQHFDVVYMLNKHYNQPNFIIIRFAVYF